MKQISQIVGYTRSRKPIYAFWMDEARNFPHSGNLSFLDDDHFDAAAVFEILVLRSIRRYGRDSSVVDFYYEHFSYYTITVLTKFEELKSKAGCRDAFAIAILGRQLCNSEFKDL